MSIVGIESRRDWMNYLKIGEMAKLNSVSVQTLRYYDHIDLLRPSYTDEVTNYRYYELSQSSHLDMILFLQSLDFTLEEIKLLLVNPNQHDFVNYSLIKKEASLLRQKIEIETKTYLIKQFQRAYQCYLEYQNFEGFKIEEFGERRVHTYPIDKNIYELSLFEYETYLRKFKKEIEEKGYGSKYFSQVGSIMPKNSFIEGEFVSRELFLFDALNKFDGNIKILHQGTYLICFCHMFENELNKIKQLHKHIKDNNLKVVGDYICEVVYELPSKGGNKRNMFIRLQVPVSVVD